MKLTHTTKTANAIRLALMTLLVCALAATMIACSSPKTAMLDGYDDESFWDGLKAASKEEAGENKEVKPTVEKGWDESDELDEDDLAKGEEAYTYIVTFSEDGETVGIMYFFASLDKDSNTLEILGLKMEDVEYDEEMETCDEEYIQETLQDIMDM